MATARHPLAQHSISAERNDHEPEERVGNNVTASRTQTDNACCVKLRVVREKKSPAVGLWGVGRKTAQKNAPS